MGTDMQRRRVFPNLGWRTGRLVAACMLLLLTADAAACSCKVVTVTVTPDGIIVSCDEAPKPATPPK